MINSKIPQGKRYDWWNETPSSVHLMLTPLIEALDSNMAPRRLQWIQYARMYQNQSPGVYYSTLSGSVNIAQQNSQWSSRNVVKSATDTATSKIGKNKPRPVFLTEDGNWQQQEKAKKLTQFVDGQFDQMKIYDKAKSVFRDGGIFGMGGLKFTVNSDVGTVETERVLIDEISVDDADAIYGNPTQLHHSRLVSKSVLKAKYPKYASAIDACQGVFDAPGLATYQQDLIKVRESYKLPDDKGKGGKKVVTIKTATLEYDEWNKPYFPFVFWRWCERVSGFWGLGIAEELYGTQLEINKLLRVIQQSLSLVAVPRVLMGPGVAPTSKVDNQIGAIIRVTDPNAVKFFTPTALNGETYNHLKWLVQSAYDQIGISEMAATGQKPAGLDSGVAIREYEDMVSERFMSVQQRWDTFFLDCAKITIDLTKDLVAMDKSPKVKVQDGDFLRTIDWKSVDLAEDKYVLRCFSANILPTTPAGRLAKVQELMQSGLIPPEEGLKLLDFPDFKAYRNQALASSDLTDKMINSILQHGKYMAPEPAMDLAQALSTGQKRYLEAKLNNVPPGRLSLLSRWIEAVKGLIPAEPVAVNPMQPMEGGAGPIATPEAAPQSPLLPFGQ